MERRQPTWKTRTSSAESRSTTTKAADVIRSERHTIFVDNTDTSDDGIHIEHTDSCETVDTGHGLDYLCLVNEIDFNEAYQAAPGGDGRRGILAEGIYVVVGCCTIATPFGLAEPDLWFEFLDDDKEG